MRSFNFLTKCCAVLTTGCFVLFTAAPAGYALPEGGAVQSGSSTITSTDTAMNITQGTQKSIINWNSYNIAGNEAVNYHQPSANALSLNRVTGGSASEIFGALNANGRVWLVNPSGIMFGPTSSVNTAGLLASNLNIANNDFLSNNFIFSKVPGADGYVINKGDIVAADGGYVALLGDSVMNEGLIQARLGKAILAGGEKMTLDMDADGMISVSINEAIADGTTSEAVKNTGEVMSDGGTVVLTAEVLGDVFENAVNNEGILRANELQEVEGEIYLFANDRVKVEGQIEADGGSVTVDSQGADFNAEISADSLSFTMNDGDTNITGGSYSGSQSWNDNLNMTITGPVTIDTGDRWAYFNADADHNGTGDLDINADINTTGGSLVFWGTTINVNNVNIQNIDTNGNDARINFTGNYKYGAYNTLPLRSGFDEQNSNYNEFYTGSTLNIDNSTIYAYSTGSEGLYNNASITINCQDAYITDSTLLAEVEDNGSASVYMSISDKISDYVSSYAHYPETSTRSFRDYWSKDTYDRGELVIDNSVVKADASGTFDRRNNTNVRLYAEDISIINNSTVESVISGGTGDAQIEIELGDLLDNSYGTTDYGALESGYSDDVTTSKDEEFLTGGDLLIDNNSVITAHALDMADTRVEIDTGTLVLSNGSTINAASENGIGTAEINIEAFTTQDIIRESIREYDVEGWETHEVRKTYETNSGGSILISDGSEITGYVNNPSEWDANVEIDISSNAITVGRDPAEESTGGNAIRGRIDGNGDVLVELWGGQSRIGETPETTGLYEMEDVYSRYVSSGDDEGYRVSTGDSLEDEYMQGGTLTIQNESQIYAHVDGSTSFRTDADVALASGTVTIDSSPDGSSNNTVRSSIRGDGAAEAIIRAGQDVVETYSEHWNDDNPSEYSENYSFMAEGGSVAVRNGADVFAQVIDPNVPSPYDPDSEYELPIAHVYFEVAGVPDGDPFVNPAILIEDAELYASVNDLGRAGVELDTWFGDIVVRNSDITAEVVSGFESALIDFDSARHIKLEGSELLAHVLDDGKAEIHFNMNPWFEDVDNPNGTPNDSGDMIIDDTDITALVDGTGVAKINNNSEGALEIRNGSSVLAQIYSGDIGLDPDNSEGDSRSPYEGAVVTLHSDHGSDLVVRDSSVRSEVVTSGNAKTSHSSDPWNNTSGSVTIDNSLISSHVGSDGIAETELNAFDDVTIVDSKRVEDSDTGNGGVAAIIDGTGQAFVEVRSHDRLEGANVYVSASDIRSEVNNGYDQKTDPEDPTYSAGRTKRHSLLNLDGADVQVDGSSLESVVQSIGNAELFIRSHDLGKATGAIEIDASQVTALNNTQGIAKVDVYTDQYWNNELLNSSVLIANASQVKAITADGDPESGNDAYVRFAGNTVRVQDMSQVIALNNGDGSSDVRLKGLNDGVYVANDVLLKAQSFSTLNPRMSDNSSGDRSLVGIYSDTRVSIDDSTLESNIVTDGVAWIQVEGNSDYNEGYDTEIRNSTIRTSVAGAGHGDIDLRAYNGNLGILNTDILSLKDFATEGTEIELRAGNALDVFSSDVRTIASTFGNEQVQLYSNTGTIHIDNSTVIADAGDAGNSWVKIESTGADVLITESPNTIVAEVDSGNSDVRIVGSDVGIYGSSLSTKVNQDGEANIYVEAFEGPVTIINTDFLSYVKGLGEAAAHFYALQDSLSITDSSFVEAKSDTSGSTSNVYLQADLSMNLDGSEIRSLGSGFSGGSIKVNITSSDILADLLDPEDVTLATQHLMLEAGGSIGTASDPIPTDVNTLSAIAHGGGVYIADANAAGRSTTRIASAAAHGSTVDISTHSNTIINDVFANGDGGSDPAIINIRVHDGNASVVGTVEAHNVSDGNAHIAIEADRDVNVSSSTMNARVTGAGDATLVLKSRGMSEGETGRNITLYDSTISAIPGGDGFSEINLLAPSGSIESETSFLNAQYLGAFANKSIGTVLYPIEMDVDVLAAYSSGAGDLYFHDSNDLEVGTLIEDYSDASPSSEESTTAYEFGLSVAANDGIVSIISIDDMRVNSVVSPRGGVYLESTEGSIYTGEGWCPALDQRIPAVDFDSRYINEIKESCPISVVSTEWDSEFGIDTFYPIMFRLEEGPNVLAGGFSYFSAPSIDSTIGVGLPGDILDPSVLSGQVRGIVEPGTSWNAKNDPEPSADIDISRVIPDGKILYQQIADPCFEEEPVLPPGGLEITRPGGGSNGDDDVDGPVKQIWPEYPRDPQTGQLIFPAIDPVFDGSQMQVHVRVLDPESHSAVPERFSPRSALTLEIGNSSTPPPPPPDPDGSAIPLINDNLRFRIPKKERVDNFTISHTQGPDALAAGQVYFYHPLFEMQMYDTPALGVDAYEFIDDSINTTSPALMPLLDDREE